MKHLFSLILSNLDKERDLLSPLLFQSAIKVLVHIDQGILKDAFTEDPVEVIKVHLVFTGTCAKLGLYDLECLFSIELKI